MVMPYAHLDRIAKLDADAAHEMMDLAQMTERALEQLYRPHGFNFGLNLGQAAGAGVAGHLHMHAMPRWIGDTNFMTTVAETRVLPEDLGTTWKRLRGTFAELERSLAALASAQPDGCTYLNFSFRGGARRGLLFLLIP